MEAVIGEQVHALLEERHIGEQEISEVIGQAEATGKKLFLPGTTRFLARLRLGEATFYVDYAIEGDRALVNSAYAHKVEFVED